MDASTKQGPDSGAYVGATLLIVIGVAALAASLGGGDYVYEAIPLGIGLAFLTAYALTRQYGFLVPGGILTGLGAGLLGSSIASLTDAGPYVVIGLGLGFVAIFAVDVVVTGKALRWWPVIPGGLLLIIGTQIGNAQGALVRGMQVGAPLLLIALGVLLLVSRIRGTTE